MPKNLLFVIGKDEAIARPEELARMFDDQIVPFCEYDRESALQRLGQTAIDLVYIPEIIIPRGSMRPSTARCYGYKREEGPSIDVDPAIAAGFEVVLAALDRNIPVITDDLGDIVENYDFLRDLKSKGLVQSNRVTNDDLQQRDLIYRLLGLE